MILIGHTCCNTASWILHHPPEDRPLHLEDGLFRAARTTDKDLPIPNPHLFQVQDLINQHNARYNHVIAQ